jgi:hypothetical protein
MTSSRRYLYSPGWHLIVIIALLFAACSIFAAHTAIQNTVGLRINGIITLEADAATVFYWVMSSLGAGFLLLACGMGVRRMVNPRFIELAPDSLVLPHGLFQRKTSRIAYSNIRGVTEAKISGERFLYLTTDDRKFTIASVLFPDGDSYEFVRDFLVAHSSRVT